VPRLLKICFGDIRRESRDLRELSAAKEAGYEVVVLSFGGSDNGMVDSVLGFEVHGHAVSLGLPRIPQIPVLGRVLLFIFSSFRSALLRSSLVCAIIRARAICSFQADVLSCHDLPILMIGYLSTFFVKRRVKPLLVYDAHEYEIGRNTERGKLKKYFVMHQERYLMRRCAFSIAVNDSIADQMQRVHRLQKRPVVVRSTPNNWEISEQVIATRRNELGQLANASSDAFFLMYHGAIVTNRGIDVLIKTVAQNPLLVGFIMGYALSEDDEKELRRLSDELVVQERIIFLPSVPQTRIWEFVGAMDVGFVMIQNTCESYYLCLPNKFFECVQSLTPILASNFPEMKSLIDNYGIGLTCTPKNISAINACIEKMRTDKTFYAQCKENLKQAKSDLCWENEKIKMIGAYTALQAK